MLHFLKNPRLVQITFLSLLLGLGVFTRDFSIHFSQALLTFFFAVQTQKFWIKKLNLKNVGLLSAFITSLGLSLILRADNLWIHPLAAILAVSSKFIVRFRGKHIYNPANLAIMISIIFMPGAWVSAGQWGSSLVLAGWMIMLGGITAHRANRSDISMFFMGFYLCFLAMRMVWFGYEWEVLIHHFKNGALLLFSFFMISDPKTIPDRNRGRILYAFLIAAASYVWTFIFFKTNGFLWALFIFSPMVPLIDWLMPASKFKWSQQGETKNEKPIKEPHRHIPRSLPTYSL